MEGGCTLPVYRRAALPSTPWPQHCQLGIELGEEVGLWEEVGEGACDGHMGLIIMR